MHRERERDVYICIYSIHMYTSFCTKEGICLSTDDPSDLSPEGYANDMIPPAPDRPWQRAIMASLESGLHSDNDIHIRRPRRLKGARAREGNRGHAGSVAEGLTA